MSQLAFVVFLYYATRIKQVSHYMITLHYRLLSPKIGVDLK